MDSIKEIRVQLERFYQGQLSEKEELLLQQFFQNNDVPEDLLAEKHMFESFASIGTEDSNSGLEEKLSSVIDARERSELKGKRINLYSLSGLAAGLLLILSVYLGVIRDQYSPTNLAQYEISDPELAYEEARQAMELVAMKLNSGANEVKQLEYVKKGMQNLQPLRKVSSGSKELRLIENVKKIEQYHRQ